MEIILIYLILLKLINLILIKLNDILICLFIGRKHIPANEPLQFPRET